MLRSNMKTKTKIFATFGAVAVGIIALAAGNFGHLGATVAPQIAAAAQVDYFLKIDGIDGESTDGAHKDWIEVMSWSWGMSNPSSAGAGGGGGSGRVRMQDLIITKHVDKASSGLLLACASGKHIPRVVLTARKAGGEQQDYLRYSFFDVFCTAYKPHGDPNDNPSEEVSFNYGKVQIEYTQQKPDGKPGSTFTSGWDFRKNAPFSVSSLSPNPTSAAE